MMQPCTKSPDGRHNFNPETGDCAWQCGVNQRGKPKPMQQVGLFSLDRVLSRPPKKLPPRIHTELQNLVYELIAEYREPPKIKVGGREISTFGYYIGRLAKVPKQKIYEWRSSVKQGRDIQNPGKVFWWYYRDYVKRIKEEKDKKA